MSAWYDLNQRLRITIIYLLLLQSMTIPTSAKKMDRQQLKNHTAGNGKRTMNSRVNIPRLYSAYRVLLAEDKSIGNEVKLNIDQIGKKRAIAEDNDADSIKKLVESHKAIDKVVKAAIPTKKIQEIDKEPNQTKLKSSLPAKFDARKVPNVSKCVKIEAVDDSKKKPPEEKDPIIFKAKLPLIPNEDSLKAITRPLDIDSAQLRIIELTKVYTDFVNAWRKPMPESRGINLLGDKKAFPSPFHLSALTELVNVVENLKQSNPVDDIVKAINDEMNPDITSLISGSKPAAVNDNQKSLKVKRVAENVEEAKTGGLYEEYKKKLTSILQADKHPRKSLNGNQCNCDEVKPIKMTIDGGGPRVLKDPTPCHCEATRPVSLAVDGKLSNLIIPCHCEGMKGASLAVLPDVSLENDNEAKSNQENQKNGGLKPYYLSNSKHRQMVWNDIPLMRSGGKEKSKPLASDTCKEPTKDASKLVNMESNTTQAVANNCSTQTATLLKNQKQLQHILKIFETRHRYMNMEKPQKRSLSNGFDGAPANIAFPQVLVNKFGQSAESSGGRMIENMAMQMNVSPVEMAQRIAGMDNNLASPTNGGQIPNPTPNLRPPAVPYQNQPAQPAANLAPMLDKIYQRLQALQDVSLNAGSPEKLPCCFAEPTDGAPCELIGSWESALLGIRINIRNDNQPVVLDTKPTCYQPKRRRRQCVKITQAEIKERSEPKPADAVKPLNITIQETLPPREHDMIDNIADWIFTAHALSTQGGPITITCRKINSNLMGTFVGFCRKCGCIDSIFGSWTFCQPSRDCQDITMAIYDRRDLLRRFRLEDMRKSNLKDYLYMKFNKLEKNQQSEQKN